MPLRNGYEGYTSKEIPGGMGDQDIYRVEIFPDNHTQLLKSSDSIVAQATNLAKPNNTADLNLHTDENIEPRSTDLNDTVTAEMLESGETIVNRPDTGRFNNQSDEPERMNTQIANEDSDSIVTLSENTLTNKDSESVRGSGNSLLIISGLLGSCLLLLFFFLWRRKRK
jgi:LPXTG-motif cell wall-anchored protein